MRLAKRRLAALMAALLMIPAQPAMAAQLPPLEIVKMTEESAVRQTEKMAGSETPKETDLASKEDEDYKEYDPKSEASEKEEESEDEILKRDESEVQEKEDAASENEAEETLASDSDSLKEGESEEETLEEDSSKENESEEEELEKDSSKEDESEEETLEEDSLKEDESEEETLEEDSLKEDESEEETLEEDSLKENQSEEKELEKDSAKEDDSLKESETDGKASEKEDMIDEEILDEDLLFEEEDLEKIKKAILATPSEAEELIKTPKEEICFNTGNHVFSVVSREDFFDNELGDACFEEDGSYTIHIPEKNPFFPYEVQFIYEGKVRTEWFMDPDDCVELGNHTFYVSASFDGEVVTQMSLKVGGDRVVVYPKKKKFTDDELAGIDLLSLLPLERRELSVIDLSMYTPVELTMVSLDQIFMGDEKLDQMDKVVWSKNEDYYKISQFGDQLNLSYGTCWSSQVEWEMIVGDGDQLTVDNIRYTVPVKVTESGHWLAPEVYTQDSAGNRVNVPLSNNENDNRYKDQYYDDYDRDRMQQIHVLSDELKGDDPVYIGLKINSSVFPDTEYDHLKVYEGKFTSPDEALAGTEITDQILNGNMTQKDAGYRMKLDDEPWITMITFDSENRVTGCLPFCLMLYTMRYSGHVNLDGLYGGTGNIYLVENRERKSSNGCTNIIYTLYRGYDADGMYYIYMNYYEKGEQIPSKVTAAYAGQYTSISQATQSGAVDVKMDLFGGFDAGYKADYSKGVYFTVFVGEDGTDHQNIYRYYVKTIEGTMEPPLSSYSEIWFEGLVDGNGDHVESYQIRRDEDSYGENSYLTFLVSKDVDLTNLAPTFLDNDLKLYAEGSSTPEISGKSYHDFSKGAVHYTTSAEDGNGTQNYWLQVVHTGLENGQLYINSLKDEKAKTRVENGVIYSIREMDLTGYYHYVHDIVLVNLGKEAIPALSAELVSDQVELDDYWSLKGDNSFLGFDPDDPDSYAWTMGELWNQAKLRIRAKEGAERGEEISGKLIIKSNGTPLMELTLTGIVGDPGITTKEIPQAVKYVPYGTMIQNNNKYSWNQVKYSQLEGKLPKGMKMLPNGELYGVPTEAGTFTFTVMMENSHSSFSPSMKTFTMTVVENTDDNVDGSTDQGYHLSQRIQNMDINGFYDQTMVSEGIYDEFLHLFLDGVKLEEGTDFTSESGSTRITIRSETLKRANTPGKHTLGVEFRTKDNNTLKRAAQNYEVTEKKKPSNNGSSGGSSSGSSGSSGSSSGGSKGSSNTVTNDAKKGQMDSEKGIITGEASGYSNWHQDETGWKLIYADGTRANGYMAMQPDGSMAEQVLWEKVNGRWYAFGVDGNVKSGWVYDYERISWYYQLVENGMQTGWCINPQDNYTYYLDTVTGKLITGWKEIDGKWYYFNNIAAEPTWIFNQETGAWDYNAENKNKPYGAMYTSIRTPDGYYVGEDGAWDGKEQQN